VGAALFGIRTPKATDTLALREGEGSICLYRPRASCLPGPPASRDVACVARIPACPLPPGVSDFRNLRAFLPNLGHTPADFPPGNSDAATWKLHAGTGTRIVGTVGTGRSA
jgi:hypothetical protein